MKNARCAFLTTGPDGDMPAKQYVNYEGAVPSKTCDYLCRRVVACAKSGRLYPLSPIDAYGDLWLAVESAARKMPSSARDNPTAYLRVVVNNQLNRYLRRRVAPLRAEYRKVEAMEAVDSLHDAAEEIPHPGPSAKERMESARRELADLMPLFPPIVQRVFDCYVRAKCDMVEAAHLAHMGKSKFYASWRGWLAVARRIVEKTGTVRH